MREIKFRGKRLGFENWLYFDMTHHLSDGIGIPPDFLQYELDLKTIGQYTGLTDKNGREIYEGDIVKFQQDYIKPVKVYWNNEMTGYYPLISEKSIRLEIIGNIHETKDQTTK